MKKEILSIFIFCSTFCFSQSYSRLWNKTFNQWEWYDNENNLMKFEKFENYCNCWKTYNADEFNQNGTKRFKQAEYFSPLPDDYVEQIVNYNYSNWQRNINSINIICSKIKEWQDYLLKTCSNKEFLEKQIDTYNNSMQNIANSGSFAYYSNYKTAYLYAEESLNYFKNYKCN